MCEPHPLGTSPVDRTVWLSGTGVPKAPELARGARGSPGHLGHRVIGVDQVPERLARVQAGGVEVIDLSQVDDVGDEVRALASCRRDPMPMGVTIKVGFRP